MESSDLGDNLPVLHPDPTHIQADLGQVTASLCAVVFLLSREYNDTHLLELLSGLHEYEAPETVPDS